MPKFAWEGKTGGGKVMKGVMEAPNIDAVINQLKKQNINPAVESIKEKKGADLKNMSFTLGSGVTEKDLTIFTRQFATMIDAGLPLVQCLDILSKESASVGLRKVLSSVKESVEAGTTLADGLRKSPKVFDELYCNMVAAGEAGGILDTVLNRLAVTIEKSAALKRQIKGAMIYPVITIVVAVAVVAILMIFVLPQFSQLFNDMGAELPALTVYVMKMSTWMAKQYGWAEMLAFFGTVFAIWWGMQQTPQTEMALHKFYLMIPALGDVIRKSAVASFTRILGTLISSGVPIMDGLDIVARIAGNRVVEAELRKIKQAIAEGKTLSEPLKQSKVFPAMVVQMIGVGEQTGALDAMLNKIADFYETEVDEAVETMTGILEPAIMMFLAVVAGGIVIAMYLPIFTLAAAVSGGGG